MTAIQRLADPTTFLDSSGEDQPLSDYLDRWDIGGNVYDPSTGFDLGAPWWSFPKPLPLHLPLILFEALAALKSEIIESSRQESSVRVASPIAPTPLLVPSPTSEELPPARNRTRPPTNLCTCDKPEPILRRSVSIGYLLGDRFKRKSERSIVSCVCKFNPIVESAQAMVVPARTARPRIVSNGPLTALPGIEDVDDLPGSVHTPAQRPRTAPSSGPQTSSTSSGSGIPREPVVSIEEIPEFTQELTETPEPSEPRSRNVSVPSAPSHRNSRSGLLSSTPNNPLNVPSGPQDIESASPSSREDRLRRHLFKLNLWRLISNTITLVILLVVATLFLWPAVEQAPFPHTNHAWAPQLVSLIHTPTNGKPAPAANITSVTSEVVIAKIATAGVPQILVDQDTNLAHNKADLNTVVANTTTQQPPKLISDPDGHFVNGPFQRTLHAEFRSSGWPALVCGLSILYLLQLLGQLWSTICLGGALDGRDEWARAALDSEKRDARRVLGVWREWKRGVAWSSHRRQCVWAARIEAWFACVRCGFVVLVLVVLAFVASVKAGLGGLPLEAGEVTVPKG